MRSLIEATSRFDHIHPHIDLDADAMRDVVRNALPTEGNYDEVLFYFSGHGVTIGQDLFFCGTSYDADRPNQTGLAYSELMDLFRAVTPKLLVTIIDACSSGALLVKGDRPLVPVSKDGLRGILQFSSSLDNQVSLGGEKLSAFTHAFLEASVRKRDGVVYYTDIANALRDDFIGNDDQTPFFVNQGTGREILVDDAQKLASVREALVEWRRPETGDGDTDRDDSQRDERDELVVVAASTPKQLLLAAEKNMAGHDEAEALIGNLFDGVLAKFSDSEFAEFFTMTTVEHADFREQVIREFMIRVLSRETRPDRLVVAEIIRTKKKLSQWEQATLSIMDAYSAFNSDITENYTLNLNCTLSRAQLKITLVPKLKSLKQIQLVLSCAPSIERCYVFELMSEHSRLDWDKFDIEGREIVRRWYKMEWGKSVDFLAGKICDALSQTILDHIEATAARLGDK